MTTLNNLSGEEQFLLKWLSKEDSSAYGECYGDALSGLVERGFAVINNIANSGDDLYRTVSITETGRSALALSSTDKTGAA